MPTRANVQVVETRSPTRCAVCHGALGRAWRCRCGTALHPECRRELGRCPSLGCRGVVAPASSASGPSRRPSRHPALSLLRSLATVALFVGLTVLKLVVAGAGTVAATIGVALLFAR